jgi:nuclear cap-binding protein subunit 2
MAHLFRDVGVNSLYRDRKYRGDWHAALEDSRTVYVGNLSFFTTEEQIHDLFSRAGPPSRIIMGLDRVQRTPCGFCFAEYRKRQHTENCVKYVNGCKIDERVIRVDWDAGFEEGRQFGRGRSGGQVRDEWRPHYDPARGGWGRQLLQNIEDEPVAAGGGGGYERPDEGSAKRRRGPEGGAGAAAADGGEHPVSNPRFRESRLVDEDDDN